MVTVVGSLTMSVDGFVARRDDSVGHLFDWYNDGDVAVHWPGNDMVSHVSAVDAAYLTDVIANTGALVVGRRVYDYTQGWNGRHPFGVPLFLVTHRPPAAWPRADAPFTAVDDVATAIARASAVAGSKVVALAGPSIIQQALDLQLLDELVIDLAPVLLGSGVRFFDERPYETLLEEPTVVEGSRAVHLRYRVRRDIGAN